MDDYEYMGSLEEHIDDELSGGSGLTPADIEGYGRALYGGMPYEDVPTAVKDAWREHWESGKFEPGHWGKYL